MHYFDLSQPHYYEIGILAAPFSSKDITPRGRLESLPSSLLGSPHLAFLAAKVNEPVFDFQRLTVQRKVQAGA